MILDMTREYEREIAKLLRHNPDVTQDASATWQFNRVFSYLGKKWASRFAERTQSIVDRMINQVDKHSHANLQTSLKEMSGGLTIKTPKMPAGLYDKLLATTAENVSLIKSIPDTFHEKITGVMMRTIQAGGMNTEFVFQQIQHLNHVTKGRAKLIATDQVRKLTSAMNEERMLSAGVRKFEWIHSGGGADPRELHVKYNGQTFDMDNPPIIDERTGQRGLPGELINCRCRMRPIIDFTQYLNNDE